MSVIQSNPEQSKHLATATMNLHGLSLDFTNLRSETYADSRIPQVDFGTPEQDAERRDFTINSLFYNLNTKQVFSSSTSLPQTFCLKLRYVERKALRSSIYLIDSNGRIGDLAAEKPQCNYQSSTMLKSQEQGLESHPDCMLTIRRNRLFNLSRHYFYRMQKLHIAFEKK